MKTKTTTLELEKAQADLLKMFTHPARIAILQILRNGEECVCHMEAILGYRQSYLSQQLSVLREGGVIVDRRDGWNIFYRVVKPEAFVLLDTVSSMVGGDVLPPKRYQKNDSCPCPKCNIKQSSIQNNQMVNIEGV
ncbi:MAG: ArsR/SmtB family transcription factor [Anaerolineaceae bacterium]